MKQIIVLGIYRSGTSMIAGILDNLGIDMGKHGNISDTHNKWGYFEDLKSIEVMSTLRLFCEKQYYSVDTSDIGKVMEDAGSNARMKEYVGQRNVKDVWGLKDPKMTPFFKLLYKYLENPYIILITRDKADVVSSWAKQRAAQDKEVVERAYGNHIKMIDESRAFIIKEKIPLLELTFKESIKGEAKGKIKKFLNI